MQFNMDLLHFFIIKLPNKVKSILLDSLSYIYINIIKSAHNIDIGNDFEIHGFPRILVNEGTISIGSRFRLNSGTYFNPIGRNQRSVLFVRNKGCIKIGNNVGMSSVAIVCEKSISIGNNVRMGGNVVIYDTDFHSLDPSERTVFPELKINIKRLPIEIGDNAFIGAHSTILKGVSIGKNSIIGAGSVVSKSIPSNEIWAGNPVKFIGKI